MISFKEYYNLLFENYVNLIGVGSIEERTKYADQVWNILQKAYESIGGIKGSGFNSKEDMIQNIPFWKLYVQNGVVLVVMMYKDKAGRKIVAFGSDGSPKAKQVMKNIMRETYKTGWGEYSKVALIVLMRSIPSDIVEDYLISPQQVKQLMPKDEITPIDEWLGAGNELSNSLDLKTYKMYPNLHPYFYVREIGGYATLKVSIGTPGRKII